MLSPQYKDKDEVWFLVVINELLFLYRVTQERSSQLAVGRQDLLVVSPVTFLGWLDHSLFFSGDSMVPNFLLVVGRVLTFL